jgi:hypothetical protein
MEESHIAIVYIIMVDTAGKHAELKNFSTGQERPNVGHRNFFC